MLAADPYPQQTHARTTADRTDSGIHPQHPMTTKYLTLNGTFPFVEPLYLLAPKGPRAAIEQAVKDGVDLSCRRIDVDLTGAHLEGILALSSVFSGSLEHAKMSDGRFARATFTCSLKGATAHRADFTAATMSAVEMSDIRANDANFQAANLRGSNLSRATVQRSFFEATHFSRAITTGMDVEGATIFRADIERAQLRNMVTPYDDIHYHASSGRTRAADQAAAGQAAAVAALEPDLASSNRASTNTTT